MKRILVVDDENDIVEIVREILLSAGYQVETACNGVEGLARLRAFKPELVLLDMTMPVMDGLAMLARLRADPEHRTVPVVLMSAGRVPDEAQRGVDRFLPKPFALRSLLGTVAELLGGPGKP